VDGRAHRGGGNGGRRSGVRAGRLTGCVFIGGTCTGASGECLSAHGGELRGGARQPTHASVAGGERGRGSGQWVGGTATGVCGAARGGFARGSRGNRIMSLGRGVEWPGGQTSRTGQRYAGHRVADASANAPSGARWAQVFLNCTVLKFPNF
jgi:hypothetical protein